MNCPEISFPNQNCKVFGIKMQKTPVTSNIPMGSLNE